MNFVQDNDLRSLRNMGQKTFEEITALLQSADFQVGVKTSPDSIEALFAGNSYHLFVEFCERNCIYTLSDLEGFDFSLLLNEPGFGVGKLNSIKEKYHHLLHDDTSTQNNVEQDTTVIDMPPEILVEPSNVDLDISYLHFAGITPKNNAKFFENGYSKIGDLQNITLGKLMQMFGRTKGIETLEKIKLFEKPLLTIATEQLNSHKGNREFDIYVDRANKKTLQEIAHNYGLTRERVRQNSLKNFHLYLVHLLNNIWYKTIFLILRLKMFWIFLMMMRLTRLLCIR